VNLSSRPEYYSSKLRLEPIGGQSRFQFLERKVAEPKEEQNMLVSKMERSFEIEV